MAESDSGQKTEQPSQRKLTSARQRGQVIQSREVNNLFMLGTGAAIVLFLSPTLARSLAVTLARFLEPASLMSGGAAAAGSLMQTGLVLATEKIGFDMERLSPIAGFKRLFSIRALLEFLK